MNSTSKNFRAVIVQQRTDMLREQIFDSADIDFEADALTIQHYRAQARELADRDLELQLISLEAQLHLLTGREVDALNILFEGVEQAVEWDNRSRWLEFKSDIALFYANRGDFAAAQVIGDELHAMPAY